MFVQRNNKQANANGCIINSSSSPGKNESAGCGREIQINIARTIGNAHSGSAAVNIDERENGPTASSTEFEESVDIELSMELVSVEATAFFITSVLSVLFTQTSVLCRVQDHDE